MSTSASHVAQALGELVDILRVVVPDRDVVAGELREAAERADGVEVIVEDRDLHVRNHRMSEGWRRLVARCIKTRR